MGYLSCRPAKGNMNQGFGPRPKPTPTSPDTHYGQDYGWGGGDAIYAARGGKVKSYGPVGSYGNRLVIDHGDGTETWYCHLASKTVLIGEEIEAGDQIAWMGATGNVTAKHLHFELRVDGAAVDPEPYFTSGATAGGLDQEPIEEEERGDAVIVYPHRQDARSSIVLDRVNLYETNLKSALGGADTDLLEVSADGFGQVTAHVYAKATPGEAVDVKIIRYNPTTKTASDHYTERLVADPDGTIMGNPTFQFPKESGWRWLLNVYSPSSNKSPVKISRLAADAILLEPKA